MGGGGGDIRWLIMWLVISQVVDERSGELTDKPDVTDKGDGRQGGNSGGRDAQNKAPADLS